MPTNMPLSSPLGCRTLMSDWPRQATGLVFSVADVQSKKKDPPASWEGEDQTTNVHGEVQGPIGQVPLTSLPPGLYPWKEAIENRRGCQQIYGSPFVVSAPECQVYHSFVQSRYPLLTLECLLLGLLATLGPPKKSFSTTTPHPNLYQATPKSRL